VAIRLREVKGDIPLKAANGREQDRLCCWHRPCGGERRLAERVESGRVAEGEWHGPCGLAGLLLALLLLNVLSWAAGRRGQRA
jgi:hypothetical protein